MTKTFNIGELYILCFPIILHSKSGLNPVTSALKSTTALSLLNTRRDVHWINFDGMVIKFKMIKLRSYLPKPEGQREITLSKFDNYGYLLFMKDIMLITICTRPKRKVRGLRCRDRMVVGFTTTCAISSYCNILFYPP